MGSGGARYGAGRPSYKIKAGELKSIDVRDFAKLGYLDRNMSFSWHWQRGGEPSGSINIQVIARSVLMLRYTLTTNGESHDCADRVDLSYTPCNYGKSRPWLICPRCNRRLAKLYLRHGRFACRHCQKVAYSSQSEDVVARSWRLQRKIEAKIGENWQRPKGMRLTTFEQLQTKLLANLETRYAVIGVRTARLMGSLKRIGIEMSAR